MAAYTSQLGKQCIVGAYTALELKVFTLSFLGKPKAHLFTDKENKLPLLIVQREWDMAVKYMTTSFLGTDLKAVEPMAVNSDSLLVSSPERAFLNAFICQMQLLAGYVLHHGGPDHASPQTGAIVA